MTISVISVLTTVYIDFHFNKHIWAFSSVCDANVFLAVSTSIVYVFQRLEDEISQMDKYNSIQYIWGSVDSCQQ